MTPFSKKDCDQPIPCGKCPECRARRASGWSFRLMQEEKISSSAYFITLTYDPLECPVSDKGFMTLHKPDVQNFMKILRNANPEKTLKYYAVGEYGGQTNRPHYHLILFNASLATIQPSWKKGQIHYGSVTGASVGYTLKYISKPKTVPRHRNDDRLPEFSLMSKGLGKNYLTSKMIAWHLADTENRSYCNLKGGEKITMPRYYKDKLYTDEQRKAIADATALRLAADTMGATPTHTEYLNRKSGVTAAYQKMLSKKDTGKGKI